MGYSIAVGTQCVSGGQRIFSILCSVSNILPLLFCFICPPVCFFLVYLPLFTKPSIYLQKKKGGLGGDSSRNKDNGLYG